MASSAPSSSRGAAATLRPEQRRQRSLRARRCRRRPAAAAAAGGGSAKAAHINWTNDAECKYVAPCCELAPQRLGAIRLGRPSSATAREAGRRSPRAAAPQQEKSARRLVALGPQPRSGLEALAAPVGGCWADGAVTCDNARCVTERWCSRAGEQARQRATGRRGVRGHGSPRGGVRGAWRLALCALAPVSGLGGGVPECRLLWDGWDARAVRRRGGEARSRRRKRAARLALSRDYHVRLAL